MFARCDQPEVNRRYHIHSLSLLIYAKNLADNVSLGSLVSFAGYTSSPIFV